MNKPWLIWLGRRDVAKASEQSVDRCAAGNGGWYLSKAVSQLLRCGTRGACIGRVHDLVESTLDGRLIAIPDLVAQQGCTAMPG